jgi:hypothetical protein
MPKEYLIFAVALFGALAVAWYIWVKRKTKMTEPIEILVKQAAKLKWIQTGKVEKDGYGAAWTQRSIRFVRGKEEAVLWSKDATITLVRVHAPPTFESFLELENWLTKNPDVDDGDADPEILYLREIERFVIRHGHFMPLLEAKATNKTFFYSIVKLQKSGYAANEDPIVVAALTLDALLSYGKDRSRALDFLDKMASQLGHTSQKPVGQFSET